MTSRVETIAHEILRRYDERAQGAPFSATELGFDMTEAKAVAALVRDRRLHRGETPVGWKIGFTNRTIWDEYGVHAPIYGPVYDTTVVHVTGEHRYDLSHVVEPRIEPEIVFRFKARPEKEMDEAELIGCLDGVAHGFEIVQSLFPGWTFAAADTQAAFALHGGLMIGPFTPMPGWRMAGEWLKLLTRFTITLSRDGVAVDTGHAANVLDGPVSALKHFIRELAQDGIDLPGPGDVVTTGTVTRAFPVASGERWTTAIDGLPVAPMDVTFA